ncbi:MAG: hypothetical protein IKU10_04705 [Clostridia bacterium]|nr:hypothetical protein [Clostridia bacterium]
MKRFLSFMMCFVLAVTACIYLPPEETIPTVSAAYSTCGHHNFGRDSIDKVLVTQPLFSKGATLPTVSNNSCSGFEAGPGLTYGGKTYNCTATISHNRGTLSLINYSSATTDQKALLDAWSGNRGTGTGGISGAFQLASAVSSSDGWGYTTTISWPTAINCSTETNFYIQFWLVSTGGSSNYASGNTTNRGTLWFNLIGDDSPHNADGWNFPVNIKDLAADSNGKINTAHYYSFPISGAHLKAGTLTSVKKMVVRYNSKGAEGSVVTTDSPTIILGKFMMETPVDNIQVGTSFQNSSSTKYTSSTMPEPQLGGEYYLDGTSTATARHSLRFPFYVDSKATFVLDLHYGSYTLNTLNLWPWRYKSSRAGTSNTLTVGGNGGAYNTSFTRTTTSYLSDTKRYSYNPS